MRLLADDLEYVLEAGGGLWEELRGQRIFLTGGTGFFGCWLLETFTWLEERLRLEAACTVLTRDPEAFRRKAPHLAGHPAVRLVPGDVRDFAFPEDRCSLVIHAATEASASMIRDQPQAMLETIVVGTRRVLDFAAARGARRLLLTSSGAVYGRQPPELTHVPEDYAGAPDPTLPTSCYGEGKRMAELLCAIHSRQHGFQAAIARCFAFVGPYLNLDIHYAVGNFIRDGLAGGPIRVGGDGTPYRSYLYAADLAFWLWLILLRGEPLRPYNVGSGEAVSIADLARRVASVFEPAPSVTIAREPRPGKPAERYVPSVERVERELGLVPHFTLEDAVRRTVRWHRARGGL